VSTDVLDNLKHEMFCQLVARGVSYPFAYRGAGYLANTAAAESLAKLPMIRDRIAELWPDFEPERNWLEPEVTQHDEWEE
jgi:hypothetical protein